MMNEEKKINDAINDKIDDLAMKKMNEYINNKYKCNIHIKDEDHGDKTECRYIGTLSERWEVYKNYQKIIKDKIEKKNNI